MNENTFTLLSPCHQAPIQPETEWQGPAYLSSEAVIGYSCTAAGCWNEWDRQGNPVGH